MGIMYLKAVKFKNLRKSRDLVEILSQALRSCNKMLFLAIKSTEKKVFTYSASLKFTENFHKSAIILLILNTNFRNLVVR